MKRLVVAPHDPTWRSAFEAESRQVAAALGGTLIAIHDIGSTSIPDIYAKPVIDILAEVADMTDVDLRSQEMTRSVMK